MGTMRSPHHPSAAMQGRRALLLLMVPLLLLLLATMLATTAASLAADDGDSQVAPTRVAAAPSAETPRAASPGTVHSVVPRRVTLSTL